LDTRFFSFYRIHHVNNSRVDILIHEYFGIDLKLTWRVVRLKIPELKEKILEIKENLEREKL